MEPSFQFQRHPDSPHIKHAWAESRRDAMSHNNRTPRVTICLLTFGDYPDLASRALDSIRRHCPRADYRLVVGANAVCAETLRLLRARHEDREIDELVLSPTNLSKCPMMRRMFARIDTEYIWWFDDDSHITEPGALTRWLQIAETSSPSTVLWGAMACCGHPASFAGAADARSFVRSAAWYRGFPPPSWRVGGGGEFNFRGLELGNGRWLFVLGGCFMIRTSAVRALDWPDPRLLRTGDDVFLGEAIRQQGWEQRNLTPLGVALDTEPTRGPAKFLQL
jgi:GT2 family glycosyltransferase